MDIKLMIVVIFCHITQAIAFVPRIHPKVPTVPSIVTHNKNFRPNDQLAFPSYKSPTARASALANVGVITVASAVGMISDKLHFLSGSAGSVVALVVSALLSNFLSLQIDDNVIDFCWKCLPASLAFLLLSPRDENSNYDNQSNESSVKDTIYAMSAPFILGSLGSIIGCIISAFVCATRSNSINFFHMPSKYHSIVAASCLVSSYIGGSVNFFATASIIKSQMIHLFPPGFACDINDLLTAMATADLLVMALYFAFLFSMNSFKPFQMAFPGRNNGYAETGSQITTVPLSKKDPFSSNESLQSQTILLTSIVSLALVWIIVAISNLFEQSLSSIVPGLGCAFVALLSTLCSDALNLIDNSKGRSLFKINFIFLKKDLMVIGPTVSNSCFMILFAAIGLTANLQRAIQHGLSSLVFALIALVVHIIIILGGSWLLSNGLPKTSFTSRFFPLSLSEVLVASNANIGGASTAAAFASKISKGRYQRPLIFGATFWGVTGYAIATSIGLILVRFLLTML